MTAESQKEFRAIKLITNIRNQTSTVRLDEREWGDKSLER
jgi:hypothetical protein